MTLLVLVGPAGVGKGTIVKEILSKNTDFMLSVSATTRAPRPGEVDGIHYHFVSQAKFEELIETGKLLEWAQVHGLHFYGTPLEELEKAERLGRHLVLEIDLQGARQIRNRVENSVSVFLLPPSIQELEGRLRGRGTETEVEIQTRLETARFELAAASEFDFQIVNDDLAKAAREIVELVRKH
ncbi:MAG: guanylate kinase [Actinomycetota bacterium]|jgi:guanylate kinase